MEITEKQKLILQAIRNFISDNSYPPSVRDLAVIFGFASPKAVTDHLKSLEKKGYIERNSSARSIKLTLKALEALGTGSGSLNPAVKKGGRVFPHSAPILPEDVSAMPEGIAYRIPLLGKIAAGNPILAEENIEEYIALPEGLLGAYGADFALTVKGDSMTGDHILEGDIIMVKSLQAAQNGEIIVALLGDEAVVKRFYMAGAAIELRSSNPAYPPIKINKGEENFRILGKVVAIHRSI